MFAYGSAIGVMVARGLGLLSGFCFTLYVAHRFGGGRETDIAFTALNIPNALSLIVGLLPQIFLSVFKSVEVAEGPQEAWRFARSGLRIVAAASVLLTAAVILFSPLVARAVSGEYSDREVARLTHYMQAGFLVLLFIGVASVLKGVLNATGSLVMPTLDTFATNIVAVAVVALASGSWGVLSVVVGTVLGGAAKLLLMAPGYVRRDRGRGAPLRHPALGSVGRMMAPLVGIGILYVGSVAIIRALAWRIPMPGALSYLNYSERVISAANELFVTSLGIVVLPSLAQRWAEGDRAGLGRQVTTGLRMCFWFGIPASAGLLLLAEPIVAFLYQHGRFDSVAARETALALRFSAPLLVFCGIGILSQAFFALQDGRSLLISNVVIVGTYVGFGFALVRPLRQGGLALAWTLSYAAGFGACLWLFARRVGWPDLRSMGRGVLGTCLATALMAAAVWSLGRWTCAHVLIRIAAGVAVFAVASRWLCREEWSYLSRVWPRRSGKASVAAQTAEPAADEGRGGPRA
jgi:putative peptidoglycan lipid II flippase